MSVANGQNSARGVYPEGADKDTPGRSQFGVKAKLFIAFLAMAAFTILAALIAWYAFVAIERAVDDMTRDSFPAMEISLRLAKKSTEIAAIAPMLMASANEEGRVAAQDTREIHSNELANLIEELGATGITPQTTESLAEIQEEIVKGLRAVSEAIKERLRLSDRRLVASADMAAAHGKFIEVLRPLVDDAVFVTTTKGENNAVQDTGVTTGSNEDPGTTLDILLALRAEGDEVGDLLGESVNISELELIQPLRERFIAASDHFRAQFDQLAVSTESEALREAADRLITIGLGNDSIFNMHERALRQNEIALDLSQSARFWSILLGEHASKFVALAQKEGERAALETSQAISDGELALLLVAAVSVTGAVLIMLFYVGPRVIRPLENITSAMTDLAAGDTTVNIPARQRRDEIGNMAQALEGFRDTAIEVQKSNLQEIRETRTQLSAAIESISEGFSLYDADDRLVVSNSTYRKLLYPGIEDVVIPGVSFETIVRTAAERGLVADATGRVEEWVTERMARHRSPGDAHPQRQNDGRWILISERKTDDGSTVAVYADITELKLREAELDEKSNALEQLSNQLAKYLSPQVYESIFSGKQEVKVTSQRKKLTVFFSDIAGFTETTEKLESEDLSRLLNEYLTEMSRIALMYGATIDKYVGDSILIFFGDPESRGVKEDALACVEMAIAMRRKMVELQDLWRDSGVEKTVQIRMGISTGYCTVGNFGSEDRMDYTIIGSGVNLASRLESTAAPGEILISYETYALVRDRIHCEERGQVKVKGIADPVATFVALDSYENLKRERQLISEDHPNVKLELNLDAMSSDERNQATMLLEQALDRLSRQHKNYSPGRPATKESGR
jgi:class 3 adenylate cyclase/HAMP domain-containing protein